MVISGEGLGQLIIWYVKRKFDELIDANSNQNLTLSRFKGKSKTSLSTFKSYPMTHASLKTS